MTGADHLTTKGRNAADRGIGKHVKLSRSLDQSLATQERAALARLLRQLLSALDA